MIVPPSERGKAPQPQLPKGVTVDDLRFVNPEVYALDMAYKGWEVLLGSDKDGNPAKVSYTLSREIAEGYDVAALRERLGLVDEQGEVLSGYSLDVAQGNGRRPTPTLKPILNFEFVGFPTAKTMQVLEGLEGAFLPEGQKPEQRVRFELLASSENALDVRNASKAKTIFERVRHRLSFGRR